MLSNLLNMAHATWRRLFTISTDALVWRVYLCVLQSRLIQPKLLANKNLNHFRKLLLLLR
jgi:hypothetical protein